MDRKKLVSELETCRCDLYDDDYSIDDVMDGICEVLTDYEEDTGDRSLHPLVERFITIDQLKDELIALLQSSDNFTADLLREVEDRLNLCEYRGCWYVKENHQYRDVLIKDVNDLIDSMIKKLSPEVLSKYKQKAIENINAVDVNADDTEDTYEKLLNISINYFADTNDRELMDFCDHWFLSSHDLKKKLKAEIDEDVDCPDDLMDLKRKIKDCNFASETYQMFEDGSYMDLIDEGLSWLKAMLLKILKEKK